MGKGNRPSLFRNLGNYRDNGDFWEMVEVKKQYPCWKCPIEMTCQQAYKDEIGATCNEKDELKSN